LSVTERLWELQNVMSLLTEKERALATKPESFAQADREYRATSEQISRLEAKSQELGKERRRLDGELQDGQQVLKKYQSQLMQVKNQVQYSAAWKEIDTARKKVKDLEDADLKVMADIEESEEQLKALRETSVGLKSRYDQEYEAWQSSLGDLRSEVEKIRQKVADIEQGIPENMRRQFHRIFQQRQGVAVARVINDSCSGCRVRLRPSAVQQVRRGEVISCEGCGRIIYFERVAS
jgi:uncharacterized protein